MTEHYTRRTVSAAAWCPKCKKQTQHRIDGVRKGPCLECIAKYDAEKSAIDLDELRKKLRGEEQRELFG